MLKQMLLGLCACLCIPRKSSAQVTPLRPLVVTLDSGVVTKRILIGLDTAYYRTVRLRLDRQVLSTEAGTVTSTIEAQLRAELARCRQEGVDRGKDFGALAVDTRALEAVPRRPFILLDPHFYQGTAFGAAALVALKIFVFK